MPTAHPCRGLTMLVLLSCLPLSAMAKSLKPGLFDIDSKQEICLVAGGTWYSPTEAHWSGKWQQVGPHTHIWGNYAPNSVSDSIVVAGKVGNWSEWKTDLSFQNILDPIKVTRLGDCTPPASLAAPAEVPFPSRP